MNIDTEGFVIYLIRHEERYDNGLIDCSLTIKGQKNSQHHIYNILNKDEDLKKIPQINIYCSPFLRTIQTIFPFVYHLSEKYNFNNTIMLEDSLYEMMHENIEHYFKLQNKPKLNGIINFFYNEYNLIKKIHNYIINQKYKKAQIECTNLLYYIQSNYYEKNKILILINQLIINLDKKILATANNNECTDIINELYKEFNISNMNIYLDPHYKQLININNYYNNSIDLNENFDMLKLRTKLLCNNMISNNSYKNGIYITHLSVIQAIIINLFELVYGINWKKSLYKQLNISKISDFMNSYNILPGTIIKLCINNNKITVTKI